MTRSNDEAPPNAPVVPGLFLRALRAGDAPALVAVQEGRKERDRIDPLSTFEGVPTVEQAT